MREQDSAKPDEAGDEFKNDEVRIDRALVKNM